MPQEFNCSITWFSFYAAIRIQPVAIKQLVFILTWSSAVGYKLFVGVGRRPRDLFSADIVEIKYHQRQETEEMSWWKTTSLHGPKMQTGL